MKKPTVFQLAEISRQQMVKYAMLHRDCGSWRDLNGFCAISSYFLSELGRMYNYVIDIVEGEAFIFNNGNANHSWNRYKNKIIDITATQFDSKLEPIHIVDIKDSRDYTPFSANDLASFAEWPKEQSPIVHANKIRPYIQEAFDILENFSQIPAATSC